MVPCAEMVRFSSSGSEAVAAATARSGRRLVREDNGLVALDSRHDDADGVGGVFDGEVHALRGVSLAIERGEMVAIMGPSGCGKTTLLNCFSGLDDLTTGDVFIEGVSLRTMDDDAKSRYRSRRMGFVFQSYNLLPVLNAVENVELPLLVARVPARVAREKALALMRAVELEGWQDHRPGQLSAGQQQRVAIARALVNDPAIVWADEPTGNLDSETSAQIMDLLVRLNKEQGQTLVLVTHDAVVSSRAHRILKMRNGQIVEEIRAR
jgi:putative ABC transport system ATP-binding protein